ncbi:hypothetical protein [Maribacter polysaccharolyticus]|uniref:hypothetical protein n=1 Tax=Maribacter polysaccharolyticus TaxID=3020831 RepID=UPI00237FBE5C|nr:hypothetical protein [Maribacter polysaccharolyticus]MDE3743567.1 hypothetical protein [Maribacter polysaccharolyticus]
MKKHALLLIGLCCTFQLMQSQGSPDYDGGLKVTLDDEGTKYFRIISWAQVQGSYETDAPDTSSSTNINLRRARILMYAQINKKFLILTHFGLNSLNSDTMSPTGKGEGSQLFFHDVWAQYNIAKDHVVGGGLHYFNGISRLNNQSTLNIMTLDNNRQSWSTLGLTDQFARHIGIFAKGNFGKLQYRVAINDAATEGLDTRTPEANGPAVYAGKRLLGSKDSGKAYAGYFDFNFLDQESNFLPFKVGSYLGTKKIFNLGAGFFLHPGGSVIADASGNLEKEDVSIFGIDAFYDTPLGDDGSALTAYATYQNNDYGTEYLYSVYGTGSMVYSHIGYVFAGDITKTRFQPYVSFASNSYDATDDNRNILGLGVNAYMNGHNSKLTLEYKNEKFGDSDSGTITLQAMIYL